MKAFRGTLIAAGLLLLTGAVFLVARPEALAPKTTEPTRLFTFEKQELVRVEVRRPDGSAVVLAETGGEWRIEGTDFVAGRSMVNRVKHQIHDLTARASVVESPQQPELYGLGASAVRVTLKLRDGRELAFEAGDPNPTAVSYYIRPLPGDAVYTVKKAAVDYYSLTLDEFRERRFASFDSDDVAGITAKTTLPGAPALLQIDRTGDHQWELRAPTEMAANDDQVRRLLGRVSALKAQSFLALPKDEAAAKITAYGFDQPRVDLSLRFNSRGPLRLLVGNDAPADGNEGELAYMMLVPEPSDGSGAGGAIAYDDTVYVARRGLLDELRQDPSAMRNRRVVRMSAAEVVAVDATLRAREGETLAGTHGLRFLAEQWVWRDGVPVSGSTPERVATTVAEIEVEEFIEGEGATKANFGLEDPIATVTLTDRAGDTRTLSLGALGPPEEGPEGQPRQRRYARIFGADPVYLVDDRVMRVVDDLVREGNRKAEKDAEKAARLERIPSEAAVDPAPSSGG